MDTPVNHAEQPATELDRRQSSNRGLAQAYHLRDALARKALELLDLEPPDDLDQRARIAQAATSLVKGWEAASDRIRIARGRPLPGSLRPSSKPQRPARRSSGLVQPPQQPEQPPQP